MPNGVDRSNHNQHIANFSIFQNGGRRHLEFLKFQNFKGCRIKRAKMRHRAKFRGDRSNRCLGMVIFFIFLRWRPSAMLDLGVWVFARVWTTHKEYLVVFIVVQNLVGIGAVFSIICKILDFARLAWKWPFTPQKWRFGRLDPLSGET